MGRRSGAPEDIPPSADRMLGQVGAALCDGIVDSTAQTPQSICPNHTLPRRRIPSRQRPPDPDVHRSPDFASSSSPPSSQRRLAGLRWPSSAPR